MTYNSTFTNNNTSLKIVFSGTSEFSAQHLKTLISSQYNVVAILTQPDRISGRGQLVVESPVKQIAKKHHIPILQSNNLKLLKLHYQLYEFHADIMVVVSYGLIIPTNILNIFKMGCINIHASLLPRWRGASPIQSAILHGDTITGVTIIKMNKKIDSGKILYSSTCNIEKSDTSDSLKKKLVKLGCKGMLITLKKIETGKYSSVKQSKLTTYAKKIKKNDALINWSQDAITLEKCIRAFNPWPVSYFRVQNQNIKVWEAHVIMQYNLNIYEIGEIILLNKTGLQIQTKKNILNIKKIQIPGKKIIHAYNLKNLKNNQFIPKNKLN
ncbi:MAG: methionyl-tRNA formyltransferase [Buchnera aphidicola (Nurudea shiraii)]